MVNQVIWLNQLSHPLDGRWEGVSHPTGFKKKEKREGGEGGKGGRSIEVAIPAKETHRYGSKRLWLRIAKLRVTRKFAVLRDNQKLADVWCFYKLADLKNFQAPSRRHTK